MHSKGRSVWMILAAACALAVGLAGYSHPAWLWHASAADPVAPFTAAPAPARTITVPAGTRIAVRLDQAVSSESAPGTEVATTVAEPLIIDGETVIPRGARAIGRVVDAKTSGRLKGTAHVSLALASVQAGDKTYPVETGIYSAHGGKHKKRNLIAIGGGAGTGALIGGLAGGPVGALIGSGAGAGAGTTYAAATGKKEVRVPAETRLNFALREPLQITMK